MKYTMRTDIAYDDNGRSAEVYGVNAVDDSGVVRSVPNVFTERARAERFIRLCNRKKLSVIHLDDVIEDAVAAE